MALTKAEIAEALFDQLGLNKRGHASSLIFSSRSYGRHWLTANK
jgi:hypothetical protein